MTSSHFSDTAKLENLGYLQFTITLRSGQRLQFIRPLPAKDLDQVWRSHEVKAKDHYKSTLSSFRVVQLSKLDPVVKKYIADQGKPETKAMDDLLNDMDEGKRVADRRKGRGESPNLEERK